MHSGGFIQHAAVPVFLMACQAKGPKIKPLCGKPAPSNKDLYGVGDASKLMAHQAELSVFPAM